MILNEPIANEEAAAIIAGKSVVSRDVFNALSPELKGRAFVVSGIEDADLLQEIRDLIADIPRGGDWFEARDAIAAELEAQWGDSETARKRAELLLRQHVFQAEQATRWQSMKRTAAAFPYWQYIAFGDNRVREAHQALDGVVLPQDDPFWEDHFPPWDWGCRCRVRAISPEEYDRLKAEDEKRDPATRRVLTERQIERMREQGTLTRAGGTVDVRSPAGKAQAKGEDPGKAFGWKPGSLVIPPQNIGGAWSAEVREAFWKSADAEPFEGGGSVGDWLRGRATEAVSVRMRKAGVEQVSLGGLDPVWSNRLATELEREVGRSGLRVRAVETYREANNIGMETVDDTIRINLHNLTRVTLGATKDVAAVFNGDPRLEGVLNAGMNQLPHAVANTAGSLEDSFAMNFLHELGHVLVNQGRLSPPPFSPRDVVSITSLINNEELLMENFVLYRMGREISEAMRTYLENAL